MAKTQTGLTRVIHEISLNTIRGTAAKSLHVQIPFTSQMQLTWKTLCDGLSVAFLMTAALVLIGHSPVVAASYYKCVDQQGHVGYRDKPCAANQSHQMITKNARVITTHDCRIAYNFATDSIARWQRREPLDSLFSYYQANDQLSDAARQIAEFIYSFDAESQNSSRVLALMMKSCESGDFGDKVGKCDAFPKAFIDSLGGCRKARHTHPDVLLRPEVQEAASATPTDRVSIRMSALQFRK